MTVIILAVVLFILCIGGIVYLSSFLTRRAIFKVIRIFRDQNAVGIANAKTVDELGLRPPDFMERMMKPRDYKPTALQILIRSNVVLAAEDGRLYIMQEKVNEFLNR